MMPSCWWPRSSTCSSTCWSPWRCLSRGLAALPPAEGSVVKLHYDLLVLNIATFVGASIMALGCLSCCMCEFG